MQYPEGFTRFFLTGTKHVMTSLYRTRGFDRQLNKLRTSGQSGVMATYRAEQIIHMLLRYSGTETDVLRSKRTKHGELRLRNCRKYDLGGGYRLITLIRYGKVFLLYVGTHDECDRWLKSKRGSRLQREQKSLVFVVDKSEVEQQQLVENCWLEEDDDEYEEELLARLDDSLLRDIFRGFCQR